MTPNYPPIDVPLSLLAAAIGLVLLFWEKIRGR